MTSVCAPLLAFAIPGQTIHFLVVIVIFTVFSIMRKINEEREKAARSKNPKPPSLPAPQKKENQFRNEIEAFLEEVGRRRPVADQSQRPAASRGAVPPELPKARPIPRSEPARLATSGRPPESAPRPKADATKTTTPAPPTPRPGAEMAARKAPVSGDLGTQVRDHLAQYLDPTRLSQQVRQDVGNSIERNLRQRLGTTFTWGTSEKDPDPAAGASQHSLLALLREPASMRTAILFNEILERPKVLRRKH